MPGVSFGPGCRSRRSSEASPLAAAATQPLIASWQKWSAQLHPIGMASTHRKTLVSPQRNFVSRIIIIARRRAELSSCEFSVDHEPVGQLGDGELVEAVAHVAAALAEVERRDGAHAKRGKRGGGGMPAGRQLGIPGKAQLRESCSRAGRRVRRSPVAGVRVPRVHDQSDHILFLSHCSRTKKTLTLPLMRRRTVRTPSSSRRRNSSCRCRLSEANVGS